MTGNLPPGIHEASWEELVARFGYNEHRLRLLAGLKAALDMLKICSCRQVYVDGSFVSRKPIPGDFDVCWEMAGVDFDRLAIVAPVLLEFAHHRAAQKAAYGGELFPAEVPADHLGTSFLDFFQIDREGNPKGIVALSLEALR